MTTPPLTDLIARLEKADNLDAPLLLEEAVSLARGQRWISYETWQQAMAWIEEGALLDAAITLVPANAGCVIEISPHKRHTAAKVDVPNEPTTDDEGRRVSTWARHECPMLVRAAAHSLTIAALKAWMEEPK